MIFWHGITSNNTKSSFSARGFCITLKALIHKIANGESCVIVERAADYVLRNYKNIVGIFVYADNDYKIKRVMEAYVNNFKQRIISDVTTRQGLLTTKISLKKIGEIAIITICLLTTLSALRNALIF